MAINDISLTAGMRSNLLNLQSTTNLLDRTQTRLSTGKRVNSALDDPVAYFTAKSHNNRASDLSAKKDGMGEAIQVIKAADKGIEGMTSLISQAKSIAESADTATDLESLANQFNEILGQIASMAEDSSYGGVNLVQGSTAAGTGAESLTVEFNEGGTNKIELKGFNLIEGTNTAGGDHGAGSLELWGSDTSAGSAAVSASFLDASSATVDDFNAEVDNLDDFLGELRSQSTTLSSNLSVIQTRQDFTENMIDTLQEGADSMTAADMNEEGANMLMLQTRQSLGTTALSLSSQAAQSVLRLF